MIDMDSKQFVIDCDKAEAQVTFDEPEDVGILARLDREEPASYVSVANVSGRIAGLCGCVECVELKGSTHMCGMTSNQ